MATTTIRMMFGFIAFLALSLSKANGQLDPSTALKFTMECFAGTTKVICPSLSGTNENNQGANIGGGGSLNLGSGFTNIGGEGGSIILLPTPAPTSAPTSVPTSSPVKIGSPTGSPVKSSSPTTAPTHSPSATLSPTGSPVAAPRCTLGQCAQCSVEKLYNGAENAMIMGCGFETSNDTAIKDLQNVTNGGCVLTFGIGKHDVQTEAKTQLSANITVCLSNPIACGIVDGNSTVYDDDVCPIDTDDECGNNTGIIIIIVVCVLLLLIVIAVGVYYVIWTSNQHRGPTKIEMK